MPSEEETKEWVTAFVKHKKEGRNETFKDWEDLFHKQRDIDVEDEMFRQCGECQMLSLSGVQDVHAEALF